MSRRINRDGRITILESFLVGGYTIGLMQDRGTGSSRKPPSTVWETKVDKFERKLETILARERIGLRNQVSILFHNTGCVAGLPVRLTREVYQAVQTFYCSAKNKQN